MSFSPQFSDGSLVPTTFYVPKDWDEFQIKFTEIYQLIANAVNTREISIYNSEETFTGKLFYTTGNAQVFRPVYRKSYNFSDASLTFSHGINDLEIVIEWKGGGRDNAGNYFPIPFVDTIAIGNQIKVDIIGSNIVVTKGGGTPPTISDAYLTLEYLKS